MASDANCKRAFLRHQSASFTFPTAAAYTGRLGGKWRQWKCRRRKKKFACNLQLFHSKTLDQKTIFDSFSPKLCGDWLYFLYFLSSPKGGEGGMEILMYVCP
uniref:Uncharacterized protein MANES_15G013600 n=1 Tax=Rhizophora mucronata TaxID=61149 RepID=A0A2P2QM39_RHIMU